MVNNIVLDYLRKYKDNYNIEDLKKEILSKGYSEDDFYTALYFLENESFSKFKQSSVTKLPSSNYVNIRQKGISVWLFILLLILIICLGVFTVSLFNFFGYNFFGFNILDFFNFF